VSALLALVGASAGAQDQHHLYSLRGDTQLDQLGRAVLGLGDVDSDGRRDVMVGAPQLYTSDKGYVRAYSGRTGKALYDSLGQTSTDTFGDRFGWALALLDDLDGDGTADVAVGAPRDDDAADDAGRVDLLSGTSGAFLGSLTGSQANAHFGEVLTRAGDLDGDGREDLLVSSPGVGLVQVISGEWLEELAMSQIPTANQVLFTALGPDGFGGSAAMLEDIDQDGRPDYALGAQDEAQLGVVHIYSGAAQSELLTLSGSALHDRYGRGLASVGDLNGDGLVDLAVGIPGDDGAAQDAGRLRVISGEWIGATAQGGTPLSAEVLLEAVGGAAGDGLGHSLAGVGDVDDDGTPDLAVSALSGAELSAPAYVSLVSGATGSELVLVPGDGPQDLRGFALAGVGDVDGDGHDDVLLGTPRDGDGALGSARLVSGRTLELASDSHLLSIVTGGTARFSLDAGVARAGHFYIVLGGFSGTEPGIPSPVGLFPLNFDAYSNYTLIGAPEFVGFQGLLDGQGLASAQLNLIPNAPASLVGFQLHFAYFTLDIAAQGFPTTLVSNAVPIGFYLDNCAVVDPADDCNGNGVSDACEIADGVLADCNQNGVPDECDLSAGSSHDLDFDGVLDECTTIIYVDEKAQGAGDGTSWSDAFPELRDALIGTPEFSQVWVAEGSYRPTNVLSNEGASFPLHNNVGIYGGFAGFETSLSERDIAAHPTILTGDVLGDDLPGYINWDENSWSVISAIASTDQSAVLDGFTITHGYAHETAACDVFAVYFTSCRGGAGYLLGSPTLRNCTLVDNFGGHHGGAIFTSASPRFVSCTFEDNEAFRGGALYVDAGGEPELYNCVFEGNGAIEGGAVYTAGLQNDELYFFGCRINGNAATDRGGALFTSLADVKLINCTITNNDAWNTVGGLLQVDGGVIKVGNTILWGNTANGVGGQAAQTSPELLSLYSCIEGWDGSLTGQFTSAGNPSFVDLDGADGIAGNADDDLRLNAGSICVDSGTVIEVPTDSIDIDVDGDVNEDLPLDLDGNPRIADDPSTPNSGIGNPSGAVVDRGAYERPGTP